MTLRQRLEQGDRDLFEKFIALTVQIKPRLDSIEKLFPEYTRHDPSHIEKLEKICSDIITPDAYSQMTTADIFVLLCSLWVHDSGMGIDETLEAKYKATSDFRLRLSSSQRLGKSEHDTWKDFVRENHHRFCPEITKHYLSPYASNFYINWIGKVAQSHGERNIHIRSEWPKQFAVGNSQLIHPPLLGAMLRLADILHFNYDRAPEYMVEHRRITNFVSLTHWKAHQVAADYNILDDICFFNGITADDEAYWFAQEFIHWMDNEVRYCKQEVFPILDPVFQKPLLFSRVENGIVADGFFATSEPITLKVDSTKLLTDLLNSALYANKHSWFREIIQNAFDACRDRAWLSPSFTPHVAIRCDSTAETIEFVDTGVGMSKNTVISYLLVAGASFWSSNEYKSSSDKLPGHVGKFGIGFMSLFAIAEQIIIETRHVNSNESLRFIIRTPRQVVRVETGEATEPGTRILVKLDTKKAKISDIDFVGLFNTLCVYTEYPIKLEIDGATECEISTNRSPSIDSEPTAKSNHNAKLKKYSIDRKGIGGVFYLPKVYIPAIDAYIPSRRGWIKQSGWQFNEDSHVYFGGLTYPPIFTVESASDFNRIPNIGCLQTVVSPNDYPLEMNLPRDQFVSGEATSMYLREVVGFLDEILTKDLTEGLWIL